MRKIFLLIFSLVLSSTLFAGQIKQIVFLGDSLSDNGNLYQKIKILPKSPPYYNGRFTNGPTWAENVGKFYYDKSYIDYENYAVGGATAIQHNPFKDKFAPPITLTGEVYDYLLRSLFVDKSNILYGVWIGANDYLYNTKTSDMDDTSTRVVDSIGWTIATLANRGAKNFVVMNLPDMGKTPYAIEHNLTNDLHAVSLMHNKKLVEMIKLIQESYPDVKIVSVNIYDTFNDLLSNPEKFNQLYGKNFNNLTKACWEGPMMLKKNKLNIESMIETDLKKSFTASHTALPKNFDSRTVVNTIISSPSLSEAYLTSKLAEDGTMPCASADQHIFWDHIHPTAAVHQVIATIVEDKLTGFDI
jgi:phospholipase/lecithinase/hemolysin